MGLCNMDSHGWINLIDWNLRTLWYWGTGRLLLQSGFWQSFAPCCPPWKAFITAWFYHTRRASWAGLLVGAILFQSFVVCWIYSYKQDESEAREHSDEYQRLPDAARFVAHHTAPGISNSTDERPPSKTGPERRSSGSKESPRRN